MNRHPERRLWGARLLRSGVLSVLLATPWFSALSCSSAAAPRKHDAGVTAPDAHVESCPDAGSGTYYPCDVAPIIHAKCQRCHDTEQALAGCLADNSCLSGPFSLAAWSDTRQSLGEGTRVVDLIAGVIQRGEMPYNTDSISPPVEQLTADEKTTILAWAKACGPAVAAPCSP